MPLNKCTSCDNAIGTSLDVGDAVKFGITAKQLQHSGGVAILYDNKSDDRILYVQG
jgi:hypothetical protein